MRRPAIEKEVDHPFGLGRKLWRFGREWVDRFGGAGWGEQTSFTEQTGQTQSAHAHAAATQETPPCQKRILKARPVMRHRGTSTIFFKDFTGIFYRQRFGKKIEAWRLQLRVLQPCCFHKMKSLSNKNPFLRAVRISFTLSFCFCAVSVQAAFQIAKKGEASCVIIRQADATEAERYAANELAETLKQITGAEFEVRDADGKVPDYAIIVGPGAAAQKYFPEV